MPSQESYPIDPMAAFYAAVTAVENGSVGEIELEFRHETSIDEEMITTISVRRDPRPYVMATIDNRDDD